MRKLFPVLIAAALALSMVGGGCAKDESPPGPQSAKIEAPVTAKKTVRKHRAKLFTGTIEDLDEAAGTVTLKGPKGEMRFHTNEDAREQLDQLEIGDKVIVKHIDMNALTIVKPRTSNSVLAWKKEKGVL